MEFQNKPNFQIEDKNGNKYWISRSVAIVVIPFFRKENKFFVPLGLRSPTMEKHPNKWGLVCGFLDWNESFQECVLREFWEELGVMLTDYIRLPYQPNYVWTVPEEKEDQTISLRFSPTVLVSQLPKLNPQCDEVVESKWFALDELPEKLAFNHKELIKWNCDRINYGFV